MKVRKKKSLTGCVFIACMAIYILYILLSAMKVNEMIGFPTGRYIYIYIYIFFFFVLLLCMAISPGYYEVYLLTL